MSAGWLKSVCIVLVLILPASLLAGETSAAMVIATGTASLNGAKILRSSTVFTGDRLETSADSSIILNATGSSAQVGENSIVSFEGNALNLNSGYTQVTTRTGMSVKADDLTIQPKSGEVRFVVLRRDSIVKVAAVMGEVALVRDGDTTVMQAGTTATVDQQPEKKKRRRTAVAVWGPTDAQLLTYAGGAVGAGALISWWLLHDPRPAITNQIP